MIDGGEFGLVEGPVRSLVRFVPLDLRLEVGSPCLFFLCIEAFVLALHALL